MSLSPVEIKTSYPKSAACFASVPIHVVRFHAGNAQQRETQGGTASGAAAPASAIRKGAPTGAVLGVLNMLNKL